MPPKTPKKCDECSINTPCFGVCDSCMKNKSFIVNNVLAYIATYIKRSSLIQLKLAVLGFFTEHDISSAKQVMYEDIKDLDLLISNVTRHNSATRSAKEAELDDIILVFHKIDGDDSFNMPRLLVEDITKLPPAAPESGACVMTLMDSMAKIQRDMQQLQQSMGTMRTEVTSHGEAIMNMQRVTNSDPTAPSYARAASAEYQPSTAGPSTSQRNPQGITISPDTVADAIRKVAGDHSSVRSSQKPQGGINLAAGPSRSRDQSRGKVGTSTNNGGLKAGPKEFQVQITNVNQEITENEIRDYIKGVDNDIVINSIKDTSSEGWQTKRFLLTFDTTHYDNVMSSSFWPSKIYFKQWFPARPKANEGKSAPTS